MKPETILEEKAKKHFCYFDTIQTKAIIEAMRAYAYLFKTEEKTDKANFIINEIGRHYGLSSDYFKTKSRKKEFIKARQIAMYFIRSYLKFSQEKIGDLFNKDHATVLNAIRNVSNYIDTDKTYRVELALLKIMFDEKLETLF